MKHSLLNIVGKVAARVLPDRLQKLAEDELLEFQCCFRKGRVRIDMAFLVRGWKSPGNIILRHSLLLLI